VTEGRCLDDELVGTAVHRSLDQIVLDAAPGVAAGSPGDADRDAEAPGPKSRWLTAPGATGRVVSST
jgi:hypothetical protein